MDEPDQPTSSPVVPGPRASFVEWAKHHWGLLVAIVVPIVTVATIVIPLVADATVRLTSAETLTLGSDAEPQAADTIMAAAASVGLGSSEIVGESVAEQMPDRGWLVRSDAPFETFPLQQSTEGCLTPDQAAWLETWGHRDAEDVWNGYLTLVNSASDGSAMSVHNIRSVGTLTVPEVPDVRFECGGGIGAGSEIIYLSQMLGSDEPALLDGEYEGVPKGSPAVLNLSPGEFLQVVFRFTRADRTASFEGSMVADVTVGETTTEVVLYEGFTRRGAPGITTTTLRWAGELLCGPDGGWDSCTMPQFLEQLRADPGYQENR